MVDFLFFNWSACFFVLLCFCLLVCLFVFVLYDNAEHLSLIINSPTDISNNKSTNSETS